MVGFDGDDFDGTIRKKAPKKQIQVVSNWVIACF